MRAFYLAYTKDVPILAQPVRELDGRTLPEATVRLPWGHNVILIEKVKDPLQRLWYAQQAVQHGWSRAVLEVQIESKVYGRQGGGSLSDTGMREESELVAAREVDLRRATMNPIKATVKGGRLDLPVPPDWPDGTEVIVQPLTGPEGVGIREEDWPATPEAVADWLKWYDSLEPLIFTEEERAALEADRKQRKEFEKANFERRAEKLRGMWE
jgi:hypothetical protein